MCLKYRVKNLVFLVYLHFQTFFSYIVITRQMEGVKTGQIYRTHQLNPWTWIDACLETSICDFRIRVQIHVIISVWLVVKNQVPISPNPIQGRHTRLQNILAIYLNIPGNIGSAFQGSTLTVVRLPGASENSTQLVRSGK